MVTGAAWAIKWRKRPKLRPELFLDCVARRLDTTLGRDAGADRARALLVRRSREH